MSLQSIGNSLSPQQIMQLLQQPSLTAADPEAAAAGQAGTRDPAGQNLPADQPPAEEPAAPGAQLAPAKAALDPATIKTLLEIQEAQSRAADDVLLYGSNAGNPGPEGDPLLDSLAAAMNELSAPAAAPQDLSALDPAQLQAVLAAMTGSAASGDAIAAVTQRIMGLLDSGAEESSDGVGAVTAAEG